MEITKLFSALVAFSCVHSAPADDYLLAGTYPDQGFYYSYQLHPRATYFYPSNINKPEFHPQLGMSPQYHDLVYEYVKDFAGSEPAPQAHTFQPVIYDAGQLATQGTPPEALPSAHEALPTPAPEPAKEQFHHHKPNLNDVFLPSDYFSLPNHPNGQFHGRLDAVKTNSISPKAHPTSLPPIGGVISNYVLSREAKPPQNPFRPLQRLKDADADPQHIKRQTADNSDGVVILAEPSQGSKASEEAKEEAQGDKEEEEMGAHPGIAQSKPSAIALAGPGGMAQASPVGTALVGQGGLAVAAPSGTAVAGPAGGSIPIHIGGEKQRKDTTDKSEEADGF